MKHLLWIVGLIAVLVGLPLLLFESSLFGIAACISGAIWIACAAIVEAVEKLGRKLDAFMRRIETE